MPKLLIVSVPHQLGKEQALLRLRSGLAEVRTRFSNLFVVEQEAWTGDRLAFCIRSLGRRIEGAVQVADDHVTLELNLPWFLAVMAQKLAPVIRKEGTLLLDKK
jgi:hypothetical protein